MELTEQEKSYENIKTTIKIIEAFYQAMNMPGTAIPPRAATAFLDGMGFLNQMHMQLVSQLPPEEVEKIKAQNNPKPPQIINPNVTVNGEANVPA